ncbi:MAG: CvpA family protein [Verrucomicrobiales bacterium]|nr:CvpA family protein [Verrucomicrobiales bacterium]
MAPIIAVILITLLYFIYAMKWGAVRLLSSSIAVAIGMAVFFAGVNLGPPFVENMLGLDLTWEFILAGSGIFAVIAYFISWAIFGFILKFLFNPDSFLHPLVDGVPGGILSLFASFVMAFVIFTGTRVAGTLFELNYVASIAQPAISDADLSKLPEMSKFTKWRNTVEQIPMVADLLDKIDPFSRRENRNIGAVTLFAATQPAREFSEGSQQMASILSNQRVQDLINSDEMANQLRLKDRVGHILSPDAIEVAADPELKNRLKNLKIDRHVDEFIQWLKTNKTPNF